MNRSLLVFILLCISPLVKGQQTVWQNSDQSLLAKALELYEKEKYVAARQKFELFLRNNDDPLSARDAQYYSAISALNLYHKDGEGLLQKFMRENPDHPKAILANYELGTFYYRDKKYEKAIPYLEKADLSILSKEEKTEAQFQLGYAHFSARRFSPSLKYFKALKKTDSKYRAASYYYAGYIEYRNGNFDESIEDLKMAAKDMAYSAIIPYMIANIYYKQEKFDEVISYTGQFDEESKVSRKADMNLLAAEAHYHQGEFKEASEKYQRYTAKVKSRPKLPVQYRMGYASYVNEVYDESKIYLKTVAASNDSLSQPAAYYLGVIYLKEDDKNYAINAFLKASKLDFNKTIKYQSLYNYAKVSYEIGDQEKAIDGFLTFINESPGSADKKEANELLSQAYLNTNNYDVAIKHMEGIRSKSKIVEGLYQKVLYYKGTELFNRQDYQGAVVMFKKAVSNPADDAITVLANFWAAEAYSIGSKYTDAMGRYNTVLNSSATTAEYRLRSYYGLGYVEYNSKNFEEAKSSFNRYIKGSSASGGLLYSDALMRIGDCHYIKKEYKEAISYYDRVTTGKSSDSDYAYFQKGVVYGLMNDPIKSQANFDIVLGKYAKSRYRDNALFQKYNVSFEQGNYEVAISGFSKLISEHSNSKFVPHSYLKRAIAYGNLNQLDKAAKDYKFILDKDITHPIANDALLGLQQALSALGKSSQFTSYLNKYKIANPENADLASLEYETAKSFYFNQQYQEAIVALEKYIVDYKNNEFIYEGKYYLADSYFRTDNYDNAINYFDQVIKDKKTGRVNKSIQRIADMEFERNNLKNAVKYYRRLANVAASKKEQYRGWEGLMKSFFILSKYDSVDAYARLIIEQGSVSANSQNEAMLYLGKSAYGRGDYGAAKDEFLNTVNAAKDENGAEAQYLMAKILHLEGNYEFSNEALFDLNANFSQYENWLDHSFLLIADNFIAMEEYFQAETTLNSMIEKAKNESIVQQAKDKLLIISEKKSIESVPKTDTLEYNILDN